MLLQSITSLAIYFSGVTANTFKYQAIPLVDETYDYVVVGGGIGGSAIATRLAQNNRFRVALIEAGEHYELESLAAVPAADVLPVGSDPDTKSFIDWGFVTTSQSGANGRRNLSVLSSTFLNAHQRSPSHPRRTQTLKSLFALRSDVDTFYCGRNTSRPQNMKTGGLEIRHSIQCQPLSPSMSNNTKKLFQTLITWYSDPYMVRPEFQDLF